MNSNNFFIRSARLEDFEEIYAIFQSILAEGSTYSYTAEEMTPERSLAYWMSAPGTFCYVADVDGKVGGMVALRPNRTGRGGHVCNIALIIDKAYQGRGIGKALGTHVLKEAKDKGYQAMQFNFVVSTNKTGVKLWQSLGFNIVGTLPKGFNHAEYGLVDVYIMHRFLDDV